MATATLVYLLGILLFFPLSRPLGGMRGESVSSRNHDLFTVSLMAFAFLIEALPTQASWCTPLTQPQRALSKLYHIVSSGPPDHSHHFAVQASLAKIIQACMKETQLRPCGRHKPTTAKTTSLMMRKED